MSNIAETLANYDGTKCERYDPGKIVILFDNRIARTADDQFSYLQNYWTERLYKLGWPSLYRPNLDPGNIRLIWYTHAGNEGTRDFPLHKAYAVKEMFDSLSDEGFRPMVLGWSAENPFPMIGGSEPPPEPQKPTLKVATTWSAGVSGHAREKGTPHDRVMAIIRNEESKESEGRRKEVEKFGGEKGVQSPV